MKHKNEITKTSQGEPLSAEISVEGEIPPGAKELLSFEICVCAPPGVSGEDACRAIMASLEEQVKEMGQQKGWRFDAQSEG